MKPRVLLLGMLFAGGASAGPPELGSGDSLQRLLPESAAAGMRFGLNGAPPGAAGVLPTAPAQAGAHWLVGYGADGRPLLWQRFRVSAGQAASGSDPRPIELSLDVDAPSARLRFEGPQSRLEGRRVLAAETRIHVEAMDDSGVAQSVLRIDGRAMESDARWSEGLVEGPVQVAVEAVDALGNRALRAQTEVWLDLGPPELVWERLDAEAGAPADVFDGRRAQLRLRASDALSGVSGMTLGGRAVDAARLSAEGIQLRVDPQNLDYVLVDGVGNRLEALLPLRVDREGPALQVFVDDQPVDVASLRITRAQRMRLQAVDAPAGVAGACVEASVWYGECRELPVDLVGLSAGRYRLDFRARDSLGNRTSQRFSVEVRR